MKLATPLTAKKVKDHFTYNAWKYLLAVVLSVFGWNMFYLQTEYRPPADKRLDIYLQGAGMSNEQVNAFFEPIWKKYVPAMEAVEHVIVLPSSQENYMTDVQLTTYLAAGQGDIYMLSSKDFKKYASQGAFLALEELVSAGDIKLEGIDLRPGHVTYRDIERVDGQDVIKTESHLYGIPAKQLSGLKAALPLDTDDLYLSITHVSKNKDNAIAFLSGLIQETIGTATQQDTKEIEP